MAFIQSGINEKSIYDVLCTIVDAKNEIDNGVYDF